ncbi:hypothetical protein EGT07_08135 [Herbaspirillum sp. HC18]|nr:hypothetical protein EGT07_08135 [Herbaspirillum sp. HC18]
MASLIGPLVSEIVGIGIGIAAGGVAIGGVLAAVYAARYGVKELLLMLRGQSDHQLNLKGMEERQVRARRERLVRQAYEQEFGKRRMREHQYRY